VLGLQDHPGSTVVTDSVTSDGLTTFIEARGGKHLRWAASSLDSNQSIPSVRFYVVCHGLGSLCLALHTCSVDALDCEVKPRKPAWIVLVGAVQVQARLQECHQQGS
jgi:hypothetical protein